MSDTQQNDLFDKFRETIIPIITILGAVHSMLSRTAHQNADIAAEMATRTIEVERNFAISNQAGYVLLNNRQGPGRKSYAYKKRRRNRRRGAGRKHN